jgi:hypothetical protein
MVDAPHPLVFLISDVEIAGWIGNDIPGYIEASAGWHSSIAVKVPIKSTSQTMDRG